jgi:sorting nexin-29
LLFGIRRNCLETGRSRSSYPSVTRGIKHCNNYRGISLLQTTNKILSNILLSRLIPYAEEVMGDHQCGFRRNRSTTDHIFWMRQILEKNWEHNEAVHQLFIDFKKAYDSVTRKAFRVP